MHLRQKKWEAPFSGLRRGVAMTDPAVSVDPGSGLAVGFPIATHPRTMKTHHATEVNIAPPLSESRSRDSHGGRDAPASKVVKTSTDFLSVSTGPFPPLAETLVEGVIAPVLEFGSSLSTIAPPRSSSSPSAPSFHP